MVRIMDIKKSKKILKYLVYIYLILFPFGQLPGILFQNIFNFPIQVQGIDIVLMLILGFRLISYPRLGKFSIVQTYLNFSKYIFLSILFSIILFSTHYPTGFLYALRLFGYLYFLDTGLMLFKEKYITRQIVNSLTFGAIVIAILGWIQYIWFADLRFLKEFGWDDHYYRLVSTMLDPTFTGILLVFGSILAFFQKRYKTLLFLILSLGFTYSRSSFLALIFAFGFIFIKKNVKKQFVVFALSLFALFIVLLPRPGGEGVKLERLHSIYLKADNLRESINIFSYSPVFGIGYNNICFIKKTFLNVDPYQSHSCSGLDNSFLVILVTTGMLGSILFVSSLYTLIKTTNNDKYGQILFSTLVALGVHSLFSNTIFYSWTMGWVILLVVVSRKKIKD